MQKKSFFIFVLILISLPAIWALFHPGFFPSHDGEWMVVRLSDFHRSLVSGQFPVRWAARLNHGYGYPVFNFLYPFSLYLGEFFYFFTGGFVSAVKLVLISSFLLSSIFMYLWIDSLWGNWAGLAAAVIYTYTPYRFLDVYVRGSLGEAVAFIFPPLIFWSADKLVKKGNKFYFLMGGFAFAGLITAHNTMAMLFTILFLGYLGFRWLTFRKSKIVLCQSSILFLGLGLSAFFWLPALHDKQYVLFDQTAVTNFFAHFPTLGQLIISNWGYGPSLPFSAKDMLSFQIGILNLAIFLVMALVFGFGLYVKLSLRKSKKHLRGGRLNFFFLFVFVFSSFLMLGISGSVWRLFPAYNLIQFPWRLLSLTTFSSAILAGFLVLLFKEPFRPLLTAGLVMLAIFLNYRYAQPESFVDRGEDFYTTNEATTTVQDEYLPIWVEKKPTERAREKVEIISGKGEINNLIFNSKEAGFDIKAENESEVQINTIYFPGWKVKVDSQSTLVRYGNEMGLMRFVVGPGEHQVAAEFGETPLRLFANAISLVSLVIAGGFTIRRRNEIQKNY